MTQNIEKLSEKDRKVMDQIALAIKQESLGLVVVTKKDDPDTYRLALVTFFVADDDTAYARPFALVEAADVEGLVPPKGSIVVSNKELADQAKKLGLRE